MRVEGRGAVRLDEVVVGDVVEGADASGARKGSRVYFIHDHAAQAPVIALEHAHGKAPGDSCGLVNIIFWVSVEGLRLDDGDGAQVCWS